MSERAPDHETLWSRIEAVRKALPSNPAKRSKGLSYDDFGAKLGPGDRGTLLRWKRGAAPSEHYQEKLAALDPEGHPPEWFSLEQPERVSEEVLRRLAAVEEQVAEVLVEVRALRRSRPAKPRSV